MFSSIVSDIESLLNWLKLGIETIGAAFIAIGVISALYQLIKIRLRQDAEEDGFSPVRLTLARFLVLSLEFQLASDVLSTAISPSWDQIGKLAAIFAIRTVMDFILLKEISQSMPASSKSKD